MRSSLSSVKRAEWIAGIVPFRTKISDTPKNVSSETKLRIRIVEALLDSKLFSPFFKMPISKL